MLTSNPIPESCKDALTPSEIVLISNSARCDHLRGRAFLYCRYDADLTPEGLAELDLPSVDPKEMGGMDNIKAMPQLAKRVDLCHFGSFIDISLEIVL